MVEPNVPIISEDTLNKLRACWQAFRDACAKIWDNFKKSFKCFWGLIYKRPGYKRLVKAKQLAYFESILWDKSNNWRKAHGLHLARSQC